MKKIIYKIEFALASALSVGNGTSIETDNDVLRRKDGKPYIPGTAFAGIYRSFIMDKYGLKEEDLKKDNAEEGNEIVKKFRDYFGYVFINNSKDGSQTKDAIESKLMVYDGEVIGNYLISNRDAVRLDDFKTAMQGSKFDFQVVNAGTKFRTFIEVNNVDENGFTLDILGAWRGEVIRIGGKTTRGLGAVKDVSIVKMEFEFPKDAKKWIEFDMYSEKQKWEAEISVSHKSPDCHIKELNLVQSGGISIRQYTTEVASKGASAPDYRQLKNKVISDGDGKGKNMPVIPGTSWAGAFQPHMKKLGLSEGEIDGLYGYVKQKGKNTSEEASKHKSKIIFSESYVKDSIPVQISRNAIDRFTGGTKEHALYTESTEYNGITNLKITIPKDIGEKEKNALCASIADLQEGYLCVGGETSIGRGMFKIEKIFVNEKELCEINRDTDGMNVYASVSNALKGEN